MEKYLISKEDIDNMEGVKKTHYLNPNARRINKSLGDITGLKNIGFHLVEVAAGAVSTETHMHYYEEECVYILGGEGEAVIGDESFPVKAGDFIGYRVGGKAHQLKNTGEEALTFIVVGQRLSHDVADYPDKGKRLYRNAGMPWNLADITAISEIVRK